MTTLTAPSPVPSRTAPPARAGVSSATLVGAAVLTGLSAGFFYAYESSVTLGLGILPDPTYVAAMTAVNDTVRNPAFALSFFGSVPALALALGLHARRGRGVALALGGALLLHLATMAITFGVSVPLNDELARGAAAALPAADLRAAYEAPWNAANLVRTLTATAAAGSAVLAALLHRTRGR